MTSIDRLRVTFSGASIGSGVATHYALSSASGGQPAVKAFWTSVAAFMFSGVSIHVPNSGDQLDDATGVVIGAWSGGTAATIAGSGAGSTYAAGVGMGVDWLTTTLHGRRRIRGRTYIVPLSPGNFDTDGTIYNPTAASVLTDATFMLSSAPGAFVIWHRPVGGSGGVSAPITSAVVPDKVSWLKSRR
jgi:hypothetical protein